MPSKAWIVADVIAQCFAAHGLDPDRCLPHVMRELVIACRDGLKIPTLRDVEHRLRNERMRQEFDGTNYAAIARRYRLSVSQVRNITGG